MISGVWFSHSLTLKCNQTLPFAPGHRGYTIAPLRLWCFVTLAVNVIGPSINIVHSFEEWKIGIGPKLDLKQSTFWNGTATAKCREKLRIQTISRALIWQNSKFKICKSEGGASANLPGWSTAYPVESPGTARGLVSTYPRSAGIDLPFSFLEVVPPNPLQATANFAAPSSFFSPLCW